MKTIGAWCLAAGLALAPAGLAFAQSSTVPGGFKVDTSQPIEINADSLEVRQKEQVAIFAGKVDVLQGNVRMRTERLVVGYSGGSANGAEGGDIRNLTASGGVFIDTGTESAKGDSAVYDVAGKSIEMTGNVMLSQGENVIKGDSLSIDLASGRSKIIGGASGRVKSIFTVPGKETKTQ